MLKVEQQEMIEKVSSMQTGNQKGNKMCFIKKQQQGFTLMELLIVLTIIGMLAALVGPTLYQRIKPAKRAAAQAQIQNFMTALDSYFVDVGRYPNNREGLKALREATPGTTNWHGPYLKKTIPKDPWGGTYRYRSPGRNGGYEIRSMGADGKEGGEDEARDVNSWESE